MITVLEARVAPDRAQDLEDVYRDGTKELPPGEILETFLVRDSTDVGLWRIITVWASRDALEQMRSSGVKPKGVQIFEAAGATPTLSVLDVVLHQQAG